MPDPTTPPSPGASVSNVRQLHLDIKHLLERRDRALKLYDSIHFQRIQQKFLALNVVRPGNRFLNPMRNLIKVLETEAAHLRALQLDIASFGRAKTGKSTLSNRLAGLEGRDIFVTRENPCTSYVTALRSDNGHEEGPRKFIARFFPSIMKLGDIDWLLNRELREYYRTGIPPAVQNFSLEVIDFYRTLFERSVETLDPVTQNKSRTVELTLDEWEKMSTTFQFDWIRLSPIIMHVASSGPVWGINSPGFSLSDCPGTSEFPFLTSTAHTVMYTSTVVIFVLTVGSGSVLVNDDNSTSNDLVVLQNLVAKGSNVLFVINKRANHKDEDCELIKTMVRSKIHQNSEIHCFDVLKDDDALNLLSASISLKLKRSVNHRIVNFLRIFQELICIQHKLSSAVVNTWIDHHSSKLPSGGRFLPHAPTPGSRSPGAGSHPRSSSLPPSLGKDLNTARRAAQDWVARLKSTWDSKLKAHINNFQFAMKNKPLELGVPFATDAASLTEFQTELNAVLIHKLQPALECLMHEFIMDQIWQLRTKLSSLTSDVAQILAQKTHEDETPQLKALRYSLNVLYTGSDGGMNLDFSAVALAAGAGGTAVSAAVMAIVAASIITGGLVIVFGTIAAISAGFKAASYFRTPTEQDVREYCLTQFCESIYAQTSNNWASISRTFESLISETISSLEAHLLNLNMISIFNEIVPRGEMLKCLYFREELFGLVQTLEKHVKLLPPPSERMATFKIYPGTPNTDECIVCTKTLDLCHHMCRACNVLIPKQDCPNCREEVESSTLPLDVRRAISNCFDLPPVLSATRVSDTRAQAPEAIKRIMPKLLQPHQPAIDEFSSWMKLKYGARLNDDPPKKEIVSEALNAFHAFSLQFMIGLESDASFPYSPENLSHAQLCMNSTVSNLSENIVSRLMMLHYSNEDESYAMSTDFTDEQIESFLDRPDKWNLEELNEAVAELKLLDGLPGPYQKFVCFSKAWCMMENACLKDEFGADETWTAWSYILLKLRPQHLVSNFHMAASCFSDSDRRNSVLLTLIEALITDNALGEIARGVFSPKPAPGDEKPQPSSSQPSPSDA